MQKELGKISPSYIHVILHWKCISKKYKIDLLYLHLASHIWATNMKMSIRLLWPTNYYLYWGNISSRSSFKFWIWRNVSLLLVPSCGSKWVGHEKKEHNFFLIITLQKGLILYKYLYSTSAAFWSRKIRSKFCQFLNYSLLPDILDPCHMKNVPMVCFWQGNSGEFTCQKYSILYNTDWYIDFSNQTIKTHNSRIYLHKSIIWYSLFLQFYR